MGRIEHLILILMLAFAIGCASTIFPKPVVNRGASFDEGDLNSGMIGYDSSGCGIVTENAMLKYNLLIQKYSKRFLPPLEIDSGLTIFTNGPAGQTYRMTPEALVNFGLMKAWHKEDGNG